MYGMLDFGKHVIADQATVYADLHDMGGLSPEEQRRVRSGDRGWLEFEAECFDL